MGSNRSNREIDKMISVIRAMNELNCTRIVSYGPESRIDGSLFCVISYIEGVVLGDYPDWDFSLVERVGRAVGLMTQEMARVQWEQQDEVLNEWHFEFDSRSVDSANWFTEL